MVEGGSQVITSFLNAQVVDQIVISIAPLFVGGIRIMDTAAYREPGHFPRLIHVSYEKFGEDLILRGDPEWEGR
jgi:3,4-dihydroxy 2-butanone 4-phosphate synthase/GTP cyclohydrolase II